jgi:arsenate reductase-like glutaredoxin family protein
MIPYNADVVREFKQKYLESLEIREFDPEVEFILSELFDNELKFYRSLINIREDITKISTKKQIEALVKEDLILQSKPR